ncbi:MAG TPA: hypothetical protein VFD19_00630 [Clostridia bacterium]|nr:hypothetical protein [Clostridia bacterium]
MDVQIRPYAHFGNCLHVSNGTIEIVASLEFGIRIVHFSLLGQDNIFYVQSEDADYLRTEDGWFLRGGARFCLAPEDRHNVYYPDNEAVAYEISEHSVQLKQPEDRWLNIEKTITFCFTDNPNTLQVKYEIKNVGAVPIEGSVWAITAVCPGGTLEFPWPAGAFSATPARNLILWNTTSLTDERLIWKPQEVEIQQRAQDDYFKLGTFLRTGEATYTADQQVFVKRFPVFTDRNYPDGNVNFEVFTCRQMMEVESLAPLGTIDPGDSALHSEEWAITRREMQVNE